MRNCLEKNVKEEEQEEGDLRDHAPNNFSWIYKLTGILVEERGIHYCCLKEGLKWTENRKAETKSYDSADFRVLLKRMIQSPRKIKLLFYQRESTLDN